MFENKSIGFIGQNVDFFSKKAVLTPLTTSSEKNSANKSLTKTDTAQINSLLLKGNSKVGDVNIFGMNVKLSSGKENLAGKKNEIPDYKIDDQGDTNACGTTSLTSVLKYYGSNVKDHWEIDKSIRSTRFDMFTTPGDIVSYAKSKGFKAGLKNNSTVEDLASFIDKGVPVIILMDPSDQYNFNMHWIVIKGYERNEKGEIDKVSVADPGGGWTYSESVDDLKKEWGNVRVGTEKLPVLGGKKSFSTGYNNLMVTIVPKNKVIKMPDGSPINTNSIKVPDDFDSVQGYGARVVGKSAILIDKTITVTQSIQKYVSGAASSVLKNLGL